MAGYLDLLRDVKSIPIYTDLDTLDMYCEFLLNDENKCITYSNLSNLQEYVDAMDSKIFITNDAKMARYQFLTYYLEAKQNKGLVSRKLALKYVEDQVDAKYWKIIKKEILNSIEPGKLSKTDIKFINDSVFTSLNLMFLHKYKISIQKMMEDLTTNTFGKSVKDCDDAIVFFQSLLSALMKARRRANQDNQFNLLDTKSFTALLTASAEKLLSESERLITQWQGLNKMLDGGFENGRCYNFIGATGGFKSGLLLNIMKSIKLANKGRGHKDPSRRPTVLFICQENNIWETIHRIFGIFASTKSIREFTVPEIVRMIQEGGFRVCEDDFDINVEFRFAGNQDLGVSDIRGIYEELENSGMEVICIIQDYIERLRPPNMKVDRRLQLIDISNQIHDLAMELDIPFITGSQFNKEGVGTIEDMQRLNKIDIGKNVGSRNISEAFGMLKNFDCNIGIVIEYDSGEHRFYLSFNKLKFRGADDNSLGYFLQPFAGQNSKIQLMEDTDPEHPLYRLTLGDTAEFIDDTKTMISLTRTKKTTIISDIELDEQDSEAFYQKLKARENANDLVDRTDPYYCGPRDDDGFVHLVWKVDPPFLNKERDSNAVA